MSNGTDLDTRRNDVHWMGRRGSASLLLAACCAAALLGLAGCESAVQNDPFERSWTHYADSVLNRGVADGSLNELPVNTLPVNQGVHEYARVDSAGPNGEAAIVPAGGSATPAVATAAATQGGPGDPANYGVAEPVVNLSLQEAIERAMQHSLAVKVEAYNPGIRESEITQALAAFDPVFFGQSQFNHVNEPPLQTTGSFSNETVFSNTVGFKKLLSSGGTVQGTAGDELQDIKNFGFPLTADPSHTANLNVSITQPLLKGFGSAYNRANIYLAQRDSRIALNVFRRQVITTLDNVEEAYLALVQAKAVVDIQTRLLTETDDSNNLVLKRRNIDDSNVNVAQVKAFLEARKADMIPRPFGCAQRLGPAEIARQ